MNLLITDPEEFLHLLTHHHDGYGAYTYFYFQGDVLSREAAKEFKWDIIEALTDETADIVCATNWEDPDMVCSHTGEIIPNAYDI